ncbi:MAG: type II secretion system protein [Elusimicrobiales bacterium]|nr:type II secretion system protein [Elusimicrobiales bacterium]
MKMKKKGFTLIELIVVTLIMGILAALSVPYYHKTVETSKATDSVALGHLLANAHQMFQMDHPGVSLSGQVTNVCNSGACDPTDTGACTIARCGYVAKQDWDMSSYNFFLGNGTCGSGNVACVRRNGGTGDYASWGYNFSDAGVCSGVGTGIPSCPRY